MGNFQLSDLDQRPITLALHRFGAGALLIQYRFIALRINQVALDWRVQIASASHPFVCVHFLHFYLYIFFTLLCEPLRTPWSPSLLGSHPLSCARCVIFSLLQPGIGDGKKGTYQNRANRRSKRVQMTQVHMASWDSHAQHGQWLLQHHVELSLGTISMRDCTQPSLEDIAWSADGSTNVCVFLVVQFSL